jgi:hypothetical protein
VVRLEVTIDDLLARGSQVDKGYDVKQDTSSPRGVTHDVKRIDDQRPRFGIPPGNNARPYHQRNLSSRYKNVDSPSSIVRVYNDDECLVQDATQIVPFAQETNADRVAHLESSSSIAFTTVESNPNYNNNNNNSMIIV